jgi:glycosyltransferase involved in cell wall biosynthesis
VPNGVDLLTIDSAPGASCSTDLIYAGRLNSHKRVDLLLRALSILHRTGLPATLCIVGDGPERGRLEKLCDELQLRSAVTFAGHVATSADVFAHMKAAKVLVLPSAREGFGMVVVEGWACGLPAVVCREPLSALAELVDEPFKGRVVESQPDALAAGIRELLTSPDMDRRTRLRSEANRFDWQQIAAQLEIVIERLAAWREK